MDSPWPLYVPGEITLIKAECYVRQNNPSLPDAITELNAVLTKAPAEDAFGIGADLSPYAGAVTETAVLTEIYRQRCIELYMQGFKMEDMRRFNRPDSEKKETCSLTRSSKEITIVILRTIRLFNNQVHIKKKQQGLSLLFSLNASLNPRPRSLLRIEMLKAG